MDTWSVKEFLPIMHWGAINPFWYVGTLRHRPTIHFNRTLMHDKLLSCLSDYHLWEPDLSSFDRGRVSLSLDIVICVWHAQLTCQSFFTVAQFDLSASRALALGCLRLWGRHSTSPLYLANLYESCWWPVVCAVTYLVFEKLLFLSLLTGL